MTEMFPDRVDDKPVWLKKDMIMVWPVKQGATVWCDFSLQNTIFTSVHCKKISWHQCGRPQHMEDSWTTSAWEAATHGRLMNDCVHHLDNDQVAAWCLQLTQMNLGHNSIKFILSKLNSDIWKLVYR
jgi:hypothetical protein